MCTYITFLTLRLSTKILAVLHSVKNNLI